jgi:hypothetical protein
VYERDQGKEKLEIMKIRKNSFFVEFQLHFPAVKCDTPRQKNLKQNENFK